MLVALPNVIRQLHRIVDGSHGRAGSSNGNANTDGNDDDTVQVSQTTSFLGMHLLEGDWAAYSDDDDDIDDHDSECDFPHGGNNCKGLLEYLATPEGRADVASADDPLGLFSHESHFAGLVDDAVDKMLHKLGFVPASHGDASTSERNYCRNNCTSNGNTRRKWSSRRSAFFAGLFVRAPLPVMEVIYDIEKETFLPAASSSTSSGDCHEDDPSGISETDWWIECFMCLLAVIPSRDEERLRRSTSPAASGRNGGVVYRTRTWSIPEFESLILMLLNDHPSPNFSAL